MIGVGACPDSSCFNLISSWCNCVNTDFREDLSVFVCTAYNSDHLEEIQNFVAEGGGLLVGGHAWYWAQTHPRQNTMTEFVGKLPNNKIFHLILSVRYSVMWVQAEVQQAVIFTLLRHFSSVFKGTSCSTKWV